MNNNEIYIFFSISFIILVIMVIMWRVKYLKFNKLVGFFYFLNVDGCCIFRFLIRNILGKDVIFMMSLFMILSIY